VSAIDRRHSTGRDLGLDAVPAVEQNPDERISHHQNILGWRVSSGI
jgi:hypothetical protein